MQIDDIVRVFAMHGWTIESQNNNLVKISRRNPVTVFHHLAISVVGMVLIIITFTLGALSNVDNFYGETLVWVMLVAVIPQVVIVSIFYGIAIWTIYRFSQSITLVIRTDNEGQITVERDGKINSVFGEKEVHSLAHKKGEVKRLASIGLWLIISLLLCGGVSLGSLLIGNS